MSNVQTKKAEGVRIGKKSFILVMSVLFAVVLLVGILTFVIPAGAYDIYPVGHDKAGQIIPDSFHFIESTSRLPIYRWITAPIEAIFLSAGNFTIIQVICIILVLGGTFKVLEQSGGLYSLVRLIITKLYTKRFVAIWVITLVFMILSSVFGLQEQLLILYPLFAILATNLKWTKFTAISFILICTGVGFTTGISNPFTVGTASMNAGAAVIDGIWYRMIIFVILYFITGFFMTKIVKTDELNNTEEVDLTSFENSKEESFEDVKKAIMITVLFGIALFGVIIAIIIPALRSYSMIIMAIAFIVGTLVIGRLLLGSFKTLGSCFLSGMVDVAPSIMIVLVAFSVKYIADCGNILHTIFYYFYQLVNGTSPYIAVILLYFFILIVEFFIPSASAKAVLIIPMLTLLPIEGLSKNIIILTYLFADGYTNVLFPTCGTLLIGLGLAHVSYIEWIKRTIFFHLLLFVLSIGFLMIGIAIGL